MMGRKRIALGLAAAAIVLLAGVIRDGSLAVTLYASGPEAGADQGAEARGCAIASLFRHQRKPLDRRRQ